MSTMIGSTLTATTGLLRRAAARHSLLTRVKYHNNGFEEVEAKDEIGYKLLNLQIKGYDYVVLEKYQGYLHKTMNKMSIQVVKSWSAPHQELKIETLGDKSTAVENSYTMKVYERNLQMKDALVTKLPLLIDIINMTSPPGVSFSIHRHSIEDEDKIYFRDSVLEKLKEELKDLKDTPLIAA